MIILAHAPVIPEGGRRCTVQLAHRVCGALADEHAEPETATAVLSALLRTAAKTSPQVMSDLRYLIEEAYLYGFAPSCGCGHPYGDHIDNRCRGTLASISDGDMAWTLVNIDKQDPNEPCVCAGYAPED